MTGTQPLAQSIVIFAREHHAYEQKKQHREIPFTHAFPEGEYDGSYVEIRYQIIEEKFHKHKRKGRPRENY